MCCLASRTCVGSKKCQAVFFAQVIISQRIFSKCLSGLILPGCGNRMALIFYMSCCSISRLAANLSSPLMTPLLQLYSPNLSWQGFRWIHHTDVCRSTGSDNKYLGARSPKKKKKDIISGTGLNFAKKMRNSTTSLKLKKSVLEQTLSCWTYT